MTVFGFLILILIFFLILSACIFVFFCSSLKVLILPIISIALLLFWGKPVNSRLFIAAEKADVQKIQAEIEQLENGCVELEEKISVETYKVAKKEFKKKLKNMKKEIKAKRTQVKTGLINDFFSSNFKNVFSILLYVNVVCFVCVLLAILVKKIQIMRMNIALKERIDGVAKIIFEKYGDVRKIDDALDFIEKYEEKINEFDKTIRKKQSAIKRIAKESWFFNFDKDKRIDVAKNELLTNESQKVEFITKNQNVYKESKNILSDMDDADGLFYLESRDEIKNAVKELGNKRNEELEKQKSLAQKQRLLDEKKERDETAEKGKIRDAKIENNKKENAVSNAIRELEGLIPVVQQHVQDHKEMNYIMLKQIEDWLDVMEDYASFVQKKDINNIKHVELKLNEIFELCSNLNSIKADEKIIKNSFKNILKQCAKV